MKERRVSKVTKRKSTVVSTQTYRKMVEEALEEAPACALDLHGIYEALSLKYEQYREDSVAVDWRNSIRHCLSINDNFVRVLPEAIRVTFYPADPENEIFYRQINSEITVNRSFWTTAALIKKHYWEPFIMNTGSNVKKAIQNNLINDVSDLLSPVTTTQLAGSRKPKPSTTRSTFDIQPIHNDKIAISKRTSITDMLVSEWIDPSSFLEMNPNSLDQAGGLRSETSSPMAIDSGNQAALFNIAVIEEDERISRMRLRLKSLHQTMPNILGPLKADFINIRIEKEPAMLPSPLKKVTNGSYKDPSLMVSLPPIFNHSI